MAHLNVLLSKELRHRFKVHCTTIGMSMRDRIALLMEDDIQRSISMGIHASDRRSDKRSPKKSEGDKKNERRKSNRTKTRL